MLRFLYICVNFIVLYHVTVVNSETLYNYIFVSKHYPSTLSNTMTLAKKEKTRIIELSKEISGVAFFLPTNNAWNKESLLFQILLNEFEGNIRYDVLLACAGNVQYSGNSWSNLKEHALHNGGVVDSAYGSPYFVKDTDNGKGQLCIAEWQHNTYIEGSCANVTLPPTQLDDATIYEISNVLLPEELITAIYDLGVKQ